jgi:hypothetical protein
MVAESKECLGQHIRPAFQTEPHRSHSNAAVWLSNTPVVSGSNCIIAFLHCPADLSGLLHSMAGEASLQRMLV